MRVVVQRVSSASVHVNNKCISQIEKGYVLLVGFHQSDSLKEVAYCARKIANLRVFSDAEDKMNLNIKKVGGSILSISQFTVYGDTLKSNRPSFTTALNFEDAKTLYEQFNALLEKEHLIDVYTGVFGENMQVSITNDGPVTIIIEKNSDSV